MQSNMSYSFVFIDDINKDLLSDDISFLVILFFPLYIDTTFFTRYNRDKFKKGNILDNIKLEPNVKACGDYNYFELNLYINGDKVDSYIDPLSLILYINKNTSRERCEWMYPNPVGSEFYPLSCSCGCPGCNGIHNGIYIKHKKKTTEWSIEPIDFESYKNTLSKRHYRFNTIQYRYQILKLWKWINENVSHEKFSYTDQVITCLDVIREDLDLSEYLEECMYELNVDEAVIDTIPELKPYVNLKNKRQ